MSESKSRAGRPPSLTRQHRERVLQLLRSGMSISRSAIFANVDRRTIHRTANRDPDFAVAIESAVLEGRTNDKEARAMSVAQIDDPITRIPALESELARALLDLEEGKPGASAKVHALEGAIDEARRAVERQRLVEIEKQRRVEDAARKAHEAEVKRLKAESERLESEKQKAYRDIEAALNITVVAIRHGREAAVEQADIAFRLRRLLGDENATNDAAWAASPIANRVLHRIRFDGGLTDVQSFPGLGEKPLA